MARAAVAPTEAKSPPTEEAGGLGSACVAQKEIAGILGVVTRQVRNLEKAGLPREPSGYPVARCVRWFTEYKLAAERTRLTAREKPSTLAEAELRKAIAEADRAELLVQKERGDLRHEQAVEEEWARILFAIRREINLFLAEFPRHMLHLDDLSEARRVLKAKGGNRLLAKLQDAALGALDDAEEGEPEP